MSKYTLKPTLAQTFRIVGVEGAKKNDEKDFSAVLAQARKAEQEGRWEQACDIRYAAVQQLVELLPDDEVIELDWEDRVTRDALVLLYSSAVDFFLVGDWEMAAAQLELLLDVDSDDHLEATTTLAFVYVAMGEWESFEDILPDLSDKSPERSILLLWSYFVQRGEIHKGELATLKRYHPAYLAEWCAQSHPTDSNYVADISSERPTKQALARELWLQTEHLWANNREFIEALRVHK